MPEFLKAWAMSLSGIIVFGSVCDMLLPNDVYKKYIHLAIGIILILALISPFAEGRFEIEASLPVFSEMYDTEAEGQEREAVIKVYKNKLCEKMKADIEEIAGARFDIRCEINKEEERFGEIEEIRIIADAGGGVRINERAIEIICDRYGVSRDKISVKYIA